MTSHSIAYALSEIKLQSERAAVEIRQELKRLGCSRGEINVELNGVGLKLTYREGRIYSTNHAQVMANLENMRSPVKPQDIWNEIDSA